MARYLNPKNDLTFKRIFGGHPHLLINFLNAVMPLTPGRTIESVEYLPSDLPPDTPLKKYSIVDVRCKDNHQHQFIIEMQMLWDDSFYNRIVFNAGKAYVRQLDAGIEYELLKPVYTLAILNENFDRKTDRFYHHFQIVNRENTDEIIPGLEFVLVELTGKFRAETIADRKLMVLWLRFLKEINENTRTLPSEMQENEFIRQAAELCEVGAFTPEELAAYDKYWDMIRTQKSLVTGARNEGLVEGEAIGLEKGEAIGLEKGEAIGLEKGEAEREQLKAQHEQLKAQLKAAQDEIERLKNTVKFTK
jgi:predicted transposase/invertase (TIGR01784 family)